MKKFLLVFFILAFAKITQAQSSFTIVELKDGNKVKIGADTSGKNVRDLKEFWASAKVAYSLFGTPDQGLKNINADAKFLIRNLIGSKDDQLNLPLLGSITNINSDLIVDSVKQNIEKILLNNEGLFIAVNPSYLLSENVLLSALVKGRINGLKDSINNVSYLYTFDSGLQLDGVVGPFICNTNFAYSLILNKEEDYVSKFQPYVKNNKKGWWTFNTSVVLPILAKGLGLIGNWNIATETVGTFSLGVVLSSKLLEK